MLHHVTPKERLKLTLANYLFLNAQIAWYTIDSGYFNSSFNLIKESCK